MGRETLRDTCRKLCLQGCPGTEEEAQRSRLSPGAGPARCPLDGCMSPPAVCGCDLAQSGFFFKNQEYICTHDYQQLYGTRCDSCGDFITGEVISALGRTYHPKCFVCSTCR